MHRRAVRVALLLLLAGIVGSVVWSVATHDPKAIIDDVMPIEDKKLVAVVENPEIVSTGKEGGGTDIDQKCRGSVMERDRYGKQRWRDFDCERQLSDGRTVHVKADESYFDPVTFDFEVTGHVEITTSDGYRLATENLKRTVDKRKKSEIYESNVPVEFSRPDVSGRASTLKADLENNYLEMRHGVEFDVHQEGSDVPVHITGPTLVHDDAGRKSVFNAGAIVTQGKDSLTAGYLEVNLRPKKQKGMVSIVASGNVMVGRDNSSGPPAAGGAKAALRGRNELKADSVTVLYLEDGKTIDRVVAVRESNPCRFQLIPAEPGGEGRRLTADRIELTYASGEAERVLAEGGALLESLGPAPAQITCQRIDAQLVDGDASVVDFDVDVVVKDSGRNGRADHARYVKAANVMILEQRGSAKAEVAEGDSLLRARRIESRRDEDLVLGEGGIELTYVEKPGGGTKTGLEGLMGKTKEPVRVLAEKMASSQGKGVSAFDGDVRMWKGETVIEAPRITVTREGRELVAENGAKALWSESKDLGAARAEAGDGKKKQPVRIESTWLKIDDSRHRLTCDSQGKGLVVLRQGDTVVTGKEATFDLDPDTDQVRSAHMSGGVTIVAGDRTGSGKEVDYDLTYGRKLVIRGDDKEPARMQMAARGQTRAEELIFYLDEDVVSVAGGRTDTTLDLGGPSGTSGGTTGDDGKEASDLPDLAR